MNTKLLPVLVVALVAALAGVTVGFVVLAPDEPPSLAAGTLLSEPRALPAFRLDADDGSDFTAEDFQGRWHLVFFGFTHCPDVCPNTLYLLDRVVEQVAAAGATPPGVVFVSVDSKRDTPKKMAEYVDYFNPAFVGVSGDGGNLQKLTEAMSVAYAFEPEGDSYTVLHSSNVLAVDPMGRLHAIFTPPLKADAIAADMMKLIAD